MKRNLLLVYGAFAVSLIILIILALLFFQRFESLVSYSTQVDHTYQVITQLNKLENYIKDAETGQRGYFLTKDSSFLEPYLQFSGNIKPTMQRLEDLLSNNTTQRTRLATLKYITYVKLGYLDDLRLSSFEDKGPAWFRDRLREGKLYMDTIRMKVKQMEDEEYKLLHVRDQNREFFQSIVPAYFGTVFLFTVVVFVISFVLILREFKRRSVYQKQLERKVTELNAMNKELEEIAFVASHDLQEPMRKIRTFADRLISKHKPELNEEGRLLIERMDYSANRMQGLIDDLINYTNITKGEEEIKTVDLNVTVAKVLKELAPVIEKKKASVNVQTLPQLKGYELQLYLLFRALIDNALKFSRKDTDCRITIESVITDEVTTGRETGEREYYYKITVRDNGIGFSEEFAEKIFMIFRRLHTQSSEYEGKGIGLAIVRRVMLSHNGFVMAKGREGEGADFMLFFPVEPDS